MFKRLKNWILNRPAEDHAVASFAWFGGAYLTMGIATTFPVLAPVAAGAAILATKVGFLEGIIAGAHVINNTLSWGIKKLFGPKGSTPAKNTSTESETPFEKSHDQDHQAQNDQEKAKTSEMPKTAAKENSETAQIPTTQTTISDVPQKQQKSDTPQTVQVSSEQLIALIQQVQALTAQVRQMQQEIVALRLENQKLKQRLNPENNRKTRRPVAPKRRLVIHRHYIQNGRMIHE